MNPHQIRSVSRMEGGNFYDKYGSRNPIERRLVGRFLGELGALVEKSNASHIHEVGCGEGVIIASLARTGRVLHASDCSVEVIRKATLRHASLKHPITFEAVALEHLNPKRHAAQLIVCCEVLEHLPDPAGALRCLQCLAQPYLLVSVPREPLWRFLNMLRLRYLPDFGNTPGHVNHWSTTSFISLLSRHVQILEIRRPFPWTMALCRVKQTCAVPDSTGCSVVPLRSISSQRAVTPPTHASRIARAGTRDRP